jgi:putative DNA primase/helicase
MSLADIVKTLGGDLCGYGRGGLPNRALIPGPGHSRHDRSVSLMVDPKGRLVVESFGRSDWREVLDDLRARKFINRDNQLLGVGMAEGYTAPDRSLAEKVAVAERIWRRSRPVAGTLSERYIRSRAVLRPLPKDDALRHVEALPVRAYDDAGPHFPAMIAGIRTPDGHITAVEITYLDRDARRHRRLKVSRKIVGSWAPGSAVRLDDAGEALAAAEGVFSALSASERFSRPAWALLSTSRLKSWNPPETVRSVLIAADNGASGRRASQLLLDRLHSLGVQAERRFPRARFDDFNTEAQWASRSPADAGVQPCN